MPEGASRAIRASPRLKGRGCRVSKKGDNYGRGKALGAMRIHGRGGGIDRRIDVYAFPLKDLYMRNAL